MEQPNERKSHFRYLTGYSEHFMQYVTLGNHTADLLFKLGVFTSTLIPLKTCFSSSTIKRLLLNLLFHIFCEFASY